MRIATVLDEETQAGGIPPGRGAHAAAMLMLIHDHLQPLPRGLITPGGPDMVTPDLQELAEALRRARARTDCTPERSWPNTCQVRPTYWRGHRFDSDRRER